MKKILFIIFIFIAISLVSYICARIFYGIKMDEATVSWKNGDTHRAIIQYEEIPYLIYPAANENLFEIHADGKYKVNDMQKAFSYIKKYDCKKQGALINGAINHYGLSNSDRYYLINKLSECI